MRRAAALLVAVVAATGCGGSPRPQLLVSAAASLTSAFTRYAGAFRAARVSYSFAGSDQLAAQIRAGARPDVFAAADTTLPDALYRAQLVGRPTVFAANTLVIAVPADSTKVRSLADLERRAVTVAIGAPSVPIGEYTRTLLRRLPAAASAHIRADVRSEDPDVTAIVGKLTAGAVDAGFVYASDVAATHGALRAIALPPRLAPPVAYAAAVVAGTRQLAAARAFVQGLVAGPGAAALRAAGLLPPPGR